MEATHERYGRAFAPGHVTGIFAPAEGARDPRARGSRGAGIVLSLGVTATAAFRPGRRRRLVVSSDAGTPLPISEEAARHLAPEEPGTLRVHLEHALPIGQGFGMSAAGATATALAVGALSDVAPRRAFEVAHLADLLGGGGLGGVAAIAGGGLEVRDRPGIPPFGHVLHRPVDRPLFLGVVGPALPSPRILGDPMALARVAAASPELDALVRTPDLATFFAASERFTDAVGLAPPTLRRTLAALRWQGAWAAQAMFGRSFFAMPRTPGARSAVLGWLERSGVRAVEVAPGRRGARRLPPQPF
ncbi:MAG TPA: sugar kinase [Thermoplasmata archaeon]|nr:sugar kinase [Thermoplasmata archaeon]